MERLSAAKIARAYGLSYASPKTAESTVLYHLKRNGIARRDKAEHIRKITEGMVDEWVRRYGLGESLRQIAGEVVDPVSVWNHLRKRGVRLREKVEAQIKAVKKHEQRPFIGTEVDRAYMMGFAKGDCQVLKHGRAIRVRTSTTHPAMASLFDRLFGEYGFVHQYPRHSGLATYEWNLDVDLDASFDFLLGMVFGQEEPPVSPLLLLSLLSGFFDAEGSIYYHRKKYGGGFELAITNTDVRLLTEIKKFMEALNVHPSLSTREQALERLGYARAGTITRLVLWRIEDVSSLLAALRLRHAEKVAKSAIAIGYNQSENRECRALNLEKWTELLSRIRNERNVYIASAKETLDLKGAE